MNLQLRAWVESDRAALRSLYAASRDMAFPWSAPHPAQDFDAHTEGKWVLVALVDGVPVGFAAIWEPDSFVHHVFVHPAWLRQSIGQALLAACVRHCTDRPTLKCLVANTRALQFYQAQGWTVREQASGPDGPYLLLAAP
jgi:GNAT superfamily N-acetyltransferase